MDIPPSSSVVAILAHPDDIKCVLGVVLRAQQSGGNASLILTTRGEGLTSAARKLSPLAMGELRMGELRSFLAQVGIPPKRFFLLGIPDGSQTLPALRDDFYRAMGQPFIDPLLKVDRVPYADAVQPGMPFFGEMLLAAVQELLARLHPTLVLTHHPQDDHADHRAVSFFARRACASLEPQPAVHAVLVYYRRFVWPPAGDHFYSDEIAKNFPGLVGEQFRLAEVEQALKRAASQVFVPTLSAEYIESNMKVDEVYWKL
jgi:LmbE family N-acetylglucosaminyl deacetylase